MGAPASLPDAVLAGPEGSQRTFTIRDADEPSGKRQQTWQFAGRTECLICHTTRAGSILGFNVPQLNREHAYGNVTAHQLDTLEHLGLFADPLPKALPRIANPFDPKESLNDRARADLHTNCAHYHRRGGGGTAVFELLHELDLKKTLLVGTSPSQGTFGIPAAENVAAGDLFRSVLYYRMAKLGLGRMPYSGSSLIDARGLALVHDWLRSLDPGASGASLTERQRAALGDLKNPTKSREASMHLLATPSGALALLKRSTSGPCPRPFGNR